MKGKPVYCNRLKSQGKQKGRAAATVIRIAIHFQDQNIKKKRSYDFKT